MLEKQVELRENVKRCFEKYRELAPGVDQIWDQLPDEVYKDAVLSAKTKRLMAMAIAVASGCRGCILFQTQHALALGGTPEEILEACGVAISMGGTMAASEATRVVQYLQELGRIGE